MAKRGDIVWRFLTRSLSCAAVLACLAAPAFSQNAETPLEGEAYTAADEAYAAFAAQDYARAAARARRSIALRPELLRLRLLLIDALAASGSLSDATRAIAEAEATLGALPELRERQTDIRRRAAQQPASEAYVALDRKNFANAIAQARLAVEAAPDVMAYRLLLLNALVAQESYGEAVNAANAAAALDRADPVPVVWRAWLNQKRGDRAGAVADFATALGLPGLSDKQRRTIRVIAADAALYANDAAAARRLLDAYSGDDPDIGPRLNDADATLAGRGTLPTDPTALPAPAQDCVTNANGIVCSLLAPPATTIIVAVNPAAEAANRAFLAQQRGAIAAAVADAQRAVDEEPDNIDYRLLQIDVLVKARRYVAAEAAITDALKLNVRRAPLLAQRGFLRDRLQRNAGAMADWNAALAAGLSGDEERNVRLALANAALRADRPEAVLAALRGVRPNYDIHALRGYALQKLNRNEEALAAFAAAARAASSAAQRDAALRAQATLLALLDRRPEALTLLNEARARGQLRTVRDADLAYSYADLGDSETALALFDSADAKGQLPVRATLDAGYAARRQVENKKAVAYLTRGLDAVAEGVFTLDPLLLHDAKRQMADLTRRWGLNTSVSFGKVGAAPNPFAAITPTGGYTAQLGTELYYRPEGFGYRNGAIFEVFGRLFETLYDQNGGPTGISTTQGVVGARWKPFGEHNLVFEADKLFRIGGNARNDTLLRAAYSYAVGTDINPVEWHWMTWQVYAEAGRYFEIPQTYATAEGRFGHSFKVGGTGSNLVFFPHAVLAANYDTSFAVREAASAGAGASLRLWFGETRYVAPPSYLELTMQYRFRMAGDRRAEGVYAQALIAY